MFVDYRRIEEYPGYIISNYGKVYSLKGFNGREMIPCGKNSSNGYLRVNLSNNGIVKTVRIHTLVGNAFIGSRTGELTFDHIDRNILNNRADNLRLATKTEQQVNQKVNIRNKLGEKCIGSKTDRRNGNEFYRIGIRRNYKIIFEKLLNKKDFSLEDAVKIRDEFLLTLNH